MQLIDELLSRLVNVRKDYGGGGITGPTVPTIGGITVHEQVQRNAWNRAVKENPDLPVPRETSRIITADATDHDHRRVIAMVPLNADNSKEEQDAWRLEEQSFLVALFSKATELYLAAKKVVDCDQRDIPTSVFDALGDVIVEIQDCFESDIQTREAEKKFADHVKDARI